MAITIGLFIKPDAVKSTTYIDENIDEKYIRVAIETAQQIWIEPIIGSGIYDQLQTQIKAATLTTLNTTLLTDHIQPAMEYWTLYELVEPLLYKFNNKNIAKKTSDNSNPIDLNEAIHLKNKFKNIAEYKTERLRLYLVQNQSDFPLYYNPGSGSDVINPTGNTLASGSGWYLGNTSTENKSAEERFENPSDC